MRFKKAGIIHLNDRVKTEVNFNATAVIFRLEKLVIFFWQLFKAHVKLAMGIMCTNFSVKSMPLRYLGKGIDPSFIQICEINCLKSTLCGDSQTVGKWKLHSSSSTLNVSYHTKFQVLSSYNIDLE